MKTIRNIFVLIIVLALVLIGALLFHPYWVGPSVEFAAKTVGPKFTGTAVALENCELNLYKGTIGIEGLSVDNPKGASAVQAASLGTARIVVDPMTVTSDVIVIKEITVKNLFVSYEKIGTKTNFDIIAETAKGDKSAAAPIEKPVEQPAESQEVAETKLPETKVIIDKLTIDGIKVSLYGIPLTIPVTVNMKDIGRETNGIGISDALQTIWEKILKATGLAAEQIKMLSSGALDLGQLGIDKSVESVGKAVEAVKQLDVKSAEEAVKGAQDAVKGAQDAFKGLFK